MPVQLLDLRVRKVALDVIARILGEQPTRDMHLLTVDPFSPFLFWFLEMVSACEGVVQGWREPETVRGAGVHTHWSG